MVAASTLLNIYIYIDVDIIRLCGACVSRFQQPAIDCRGDETASVFWKPPAAPFQPQRLGLQVLGHFHLLFTLLLVVGLRRTEQMSRGGAEREAAG